MKKTWWWEGVRFECQGSGKCCLSRGKYGYVYLTPKDRRRLAEHLKLTTREFTAKHCDTHLGLYHLKHPELDCSFLEGKRCTVYEGRPAQCRTWPFWPETMGARAWKKEVSDFCPGVGKGKLYTAVEIKKLLAQDPLEQGS